MSLKIMVVDDEPKFPKVLRSLATPLGHAVSAFEDCQAGADRIQSQRLDVAFVSLNLPESDRVELIRRIRNSELSRDAKIVFLSGTEEISTMRKGFGEGADIVLARPVSGDHLLRMLAALASPQLKARKPAARLPLFTEVMCTWNDREFSLRSLNISESGMLLQPSVDAEVGAHVSLEFKIQEVDVSLKVLAQIVRKEGAERVAVSFIDLEPEYQNAIHVYITEGAKDLSQPRDLSDMRLHRLFRP